MNSISVPALGDFVWCVASGHPVIIRRVKNRRRNRGTENLGDSQGVVKQLDAGISLSAADLTAFLAASAMSD